MRVALLVAIVILSGCATVQNAPATSDGDDPVAGVPDDHNTTAPSYEAITGATKLRAKASPEGAITAFRMTLPPDAGYVRNGDHVLDLSIDDASGGGLVSFAILAFDLSSGQAELLATSMGAAGRYQDYTSGTNYTWTQTSLYGGIRGYSTASWGGREIAMVIAARGSEADLDLTAYALKIDPWADEGAGFQAHARDRVKMRDATLPEIVASGEGSGLRVGSYSRVVWPWADHDSERRQGDISVIHDSLAAGDGNRDIYGFAADFEQGWSYGRGYENNDGSVGRWELLGDAHGMALDDRGALAKHPESSMGSVVTGYGIYEFVSEGPGGAEKTFTLEVANTGEEIYHSVEMVSLGATVESLFGVPSREFYHGYGTVSRWTRTAGDILQP